METNQLTFTRFIAAFFIVVFHFGKNIFTTEFDFINVQLNNLNLGVSYFYVLSGFVMMLAYANKGIIEKKKYWINRIARVYPLHFFTLILSIIISILLSINYLDYYHFNFESFLFNLFLINTWIPKFSLDFNVPAWSVSVEMFFYFLFPFIYNYCSKYKFIHFKYYIIIFWFISQLLMNIYYFSDFYEGYNSLSRYFLKYNPFLHLNSFLVGILFGDYYLKNKLKISKNNDFKILTTFILITILVFYTKDLFIHNGLLAFPFAYLILLIASNRSWIYKIFNKRLFVHLGEISFALYLLQNPVFIFCKKIFTLLNIVNEYLIFFIGFIILLICSHLTYKYIEIPFKNKIRQIKFR